MRVLLLLMFICGLIAQPSVRLSQDKQAQVENILATERQRAERNFRQTLVITDESLVSLKDQGVPNRVLDSLGSMENKKFKSETKVLDKLKDKLESDDFTTYQPMILARARRTLKFDAAFIEEVTCLVVQTQASQPKGKEISEDLDEQHRRFLKNIISFAEREEGFPNEITLTTDLLEKYFAREKRCGEDPCKGCPCSNCKPKC